MEDFSLIEKLNELMNIIIHKPLFLFCTMVAVALLIFYIVSIKKERDINKWVFISIWSILVVILIINYNGVVVNLLDNFFDNVFDALYFPDLGVYIIILLVSNFSFFYSVFSKKADKANKIINFITVLIIDVFLILITDIVSVNKINVHDELTIYSNTSLLVLLQLTSSVFASWILLLLLSSARRKLKKYDVEKIKKPEIIFEDV